MYTKQDAQRIVDECNEDWRSDPHPDGFDKSEFDQIVSLAFCIDYDPNSKDESFYVDAGVLVNDYLTDFFYIDDHIESLLNEQSLAEYLGEESILDIGACENSHTFYGLKNVPDAIEKVRQILLDAGFVEMDGSYRQSKT